MLRQARLREGKQRQRATAEYEYAVKKHDAEVRKAEAVRDQARAQHRWLAWLRGVLAVRRIRRLAPAPPKTSIAPTDEESKIAAGIEGERLAADDLGRALGDDWVLLRGYRNRRGEIDHLLVGPAGLVAIEVKNINGTVHCDGDNWRVDKYDKYGNLVEQYALVDQGKRQRSPSVQLNEPTDLLEDFLHSRGANVDVLRVVLLTHPRAKVGNCRQATVHVFTRTSEIIRLIRKVPQPLDEARRARICDLITTDHRYHTRHRGAR
jgi:Holliday junction resolvase-like predicted endonuclease